MATWGESIRSLKLTAGHKLVSTRPSLSSGGPTKALVVTDMPLSFLDALSVFSPVFEPVLWLVSPAFRERTRERWARSDRGVRIGEVGVWLTVWSAILALSVVVVTGWLKSSD